MARTVGVPAASCGASSSTVVDNCSATASARPALRAADVSVTAISMMTVSSGALASIRPASSSGRMSRSSSLMTGWRTTGVVASRANDVTWFWV